MPLSQWLPIFSLYTLAPQPTTSNISTPATQKPQPSKMLMVTGPAAMPAARSHHASYFLGERGESLDNFLYRYKKLTDGHNLMEQQKVDWVIRYVAHSQHDL